MKRLIKQSNFIIFMFILLLLVSLKSYSHISTSLRSILPEGESKALIQAFEETQSAKLLLLTVKGFDDKALKEIKAYEKALLALSYIEKPQLSKNMALYTHRDEYKLFHKDLNRTKLCQLDIQEELKERYIKMVDAFFPAPIDRLDPFELFIDTQEKKGITLKNGYLILGEYGYITTFVLKSNTLDEHQKLYDEIHSIVIEQNGTRMFSPLFYFVENADAIRSDVNKIILIAFSILILLYLIILKDIRLLFNTMITLASSAMFAIIILSLFYTEISIFVYVLGISISTIAIDYMFHHYLHGYYNNYNYNIEKKKNTYVYNREVFLGFFTTVSAFFLLSFSPFLLIEQIALFACLSLLISYVHFAFLYPLIGFKPFGSVVKITKKSFKFLSAKTFLILSLMIIVSSSLWINFDFNLRNLDYDNKKLKMDELFFTQHFEGEEREAFVLKSATIEGLIEQSNRFKKRFPSLRLPLASLLPQKKFDKNQIELHDLEALRSELDNVSKMLNFKEGYFKEAYAWDKISPEYTLESIQSYGIDIVKINKHYVTFGTVKKEYYQNLLSYNPIESISLKERFEERMRLSMDRLIELGLFSLFLIIFLLYIITKEAFIYALVFLSFPLALVALYGYFVPLNVLHIFMLFIVLAIGIDYAIYLSRQNDALTKEAIVYSLVSTFAGFGVLIFSDINALFSLGSVATLGIVAIFILLFFMKGFTRDET